MMWKEKIIAPKKKTGPCFLQDLLLQTRLPLSTQGVGMRVGVRVEVEGFRTLGLPHTALWWSAILESSA